MISPLHLAAEGEVGGCCDLDELLFPQIVQAGLTRLPRPFAVAAIDVGSFGFCDKHDSTEYLPEIQDLPSGLCFVFS